MRAEASDILAPFGFTSLEAEIYLFLLKDSPATGYRVAQAIGKAAANTYKAIESLQQKGAVLVEDGASRMCRAVPSQELLARLTRDFEWRRAEAELALSRVDAEVNDDRVYTLKSRAQVLERARRMLGEARFCALAACSSDVAHQIADFLSAAAERGTQAFLLTAHGPDPEGVKCAHAHASDLLSELRLVVDGRDALLARFGPQEGTQAVWTQSAFLASAIHRGLSAEMREAGLPAPLLEATPALEGLLRI